MIVRQAEPRDLSRVEAMFKELCDFFAGKNPRHPIEPHALLNPDVKARDNGIATFLWIKLTNEEHILLVGEDEAGELVGFITGWIVYYPSIFKHQKVGEIQFMWPLSFDKSHKLRQAFDKWARSHGATASSNYAAVGHESSIKAFKRAGRQLTHYCFFAPYVQEEKHHDRFHG
jgi:hypothetical protein